MEMSEDEDDLEALQIICDKIRGKYGSDTFLSGRQKDRRKATKFLNQQLDVYRQLQNNSRQTKVIQRFRKYTEQDCKTIRKTMLISEMMPEKKKK